ncbi:MAG TPA: hypothetical protein VFV39_08725 [Limnobacter sp.]|nr:hypothetical protein [Limnobacter sp.]
MGTFFWSSVTQDKIDSWAVHLDEPSPVPEGSKTEFTQAVRTLFAIHALNMMDHLEAMHDPFAMAGDGTFGLKGFQLLAGLTPDHPLWDKIAPGSTWEERRNMIDAASVVCQPGNEAFLAELLGADGALNMVDILVWSNLVLNGTLSDQQIGHSRQVANGNCFALAAVNAIASTPEGLALLERSIVQNPDGSYTITFAGDPNSPVIVTHKDIITHTDFSSGDVDMLILQVAIEKYANAFPQRLGISTIRAGGTSAEVLQLLTGQNFVSYVLRFDPVATKNVLLRLADTGWPTTFSAFVGADGLPSRSGSSFAHAYTILDIDAEAGLVTFTNPWDSGKPITMQIDDFCTRVNSLNTLADADLQMEIPTILRVDQAAGTVTYINPRVGSDPVTVPFLDFRL